MFLLKSKGELSRIYRERRVISRERQQACENGKESLSAAWAEDNCILSPDFDAKQDENA